MLSVFVRKASGSSVGRGYAVCRSNAVGGDVHCELSEEQAVELVRGIMLALDDKSLANILVHGSSRP